MTEVIQKWLIGVTCAAMICALIEGMVPGGSTKRICRLAGGLLIMLAAMAPVLKFDEVDLEKAMKRYQIETVSYVTELEQKNSFIYETIIAENTAAYILDKATELGINNIDVYVKVRHQEDGTAVPHSVVLEGVWSEEEKLLLQDVIETELNIPVSSQEFKEINK